MRLGGTISSASYVHVRNALTGVTVEGFVFYVDGQGTWFADFYGLGLGDNALTVTADSDGRGKRTSSAHITVARPLQPVNLIFNGADQNSASTFWTDGSSFGSSHKIALFQDGTGRSTTGSALGESAGAVAGFTWSMLGPDSIQIVNCSTCSFQMLSRISGSVDEGVSFGQIETIGGAFETALHGFSLANGKL